jgi:hypothetical protein
MPARVDWYRGTKMPADPAENRLEPLPPWVELAVAAFAAVLFSGALFRLFRGLFASRFSSVLACLVMAAVGAFLLRWSARRTVEWRLPVAAVCAACGFYYSWRAQVEGVAPLGYLEGGDVVLRAASGTTALVLFIVAGVVLGRHLLGSWRDD